jgi:hypothetical protein
LNEALTMGGGWRGRLTAMKIVDVRTRKLADDRVEAVAITDAEDQDGAPVVVRGHGATPEEAIADARARVDAGP